MARKYRHKPKFSEYLKNLFKPKDYDSPLKRSLSGYEIEFTLVDKEGNVVNKANKIIKDCKKLDEDFPITPEAGGNMVELHALPHTSIKQTGLFMIERVEDVMKVCEENDCMLLPFGSYPGKFETSFKKSRRYKYIQRVLGDKFEIGAQTFGFHYHYTLPKGVFDKEKKELDQKIYSKVKKTLIDSYNFLIAADPILTTFSQASPFFQGEYHGKDSRLLFWRGGEELDFEGLFSENSELGELQPYKQTMADMIKEIERKDAYFRNLMEEEGLPQSFIDEKETMDYIWNPVKVNKVGTLEHRSMDTNYLDILLGISVMIKFILRAIQQDFYHVMPSDIGLEEPFKIEGNVIFIPPHSKVREVWQSKAAYKGMSDKEIYEACKRFYNLARKLVYESYLPALEPIKDMLKKRRTISDQVLNYAKRKGWKKGEELSPELSRKIALMHAKRFKNKIKKTKEIYSELI